MCLSKTHINLSFRLLIYISYMTGTYTITISNTNTHIDKHVKRTHMMGGHKVKIIPVIGVEGHDVVHWLPSWQLQGPGTFGQCQVPPQSELQRQRTLYIFLSVLVTYSLSPPNPPPALMVKLSQFSLPEHTYTHSATS